MDLKSKTETVARPSVAVVIPCFNEALTIESVIGEITHVLPEADIYVYDNNSQDQTAEIALRAGATVRSESRQGKGFVMQRMFREVDADVVLMLDGDSTYPASEARRLIDPILSGDADMVVGSRLMSASGSEFRSLNWFGNKIFLRLVNNVFKIRLTDVLSGYRAFSRRFVKCIPIFAGGFDTEVEMTIKALAQGYRVVEVPVGLSPRPDGSYSKIRIIRDGSLILRMIVGLFRDYKPLTFFGGLSILLMAVGLMLGGFVIYEFVQTGLVLRFPTAILAVGIVIAGIISLTIGVILHTLARRSREIEHQLRAIYEEVENLRR